MSERFATYHIDNGKTIEQQEQAKQHKIYFAMVRHAIGLIGAIFELVTGSKPPNIK
jgi:hypothetical protein